MPPRFCISSSTASTPFCFMIATPVWIPIMGFSNFFENPAERFSGSGHGSFTASLADDPCKPNPVVMAMAPKAVAFFTNALREKEFSLFPSMDTYFYHIFSHKDSKAQRDTKKKKK